MTTNDITEIDNSRVSGAIFLIICFWLIFTVVAYGAVDTGTLAILSLLAALCVILWAVDGWRRGRLEIQPSVLVIPLVGWLAIGLIQLLPLGDPEVPAGALTVPAADSISLDPYGTRLFLVRLTIYIVFFALTLAFINTRQRYRKIVLMIVVFGGLIAFFGIIQWLAKPASIYGLRPTPQALPFGPFVNQHHFAALMEMTIGVTLGLLIAGGSARDKKPLLMIAAAIMAIAVVLTGSRGGILSMLGVGLIIVLFHIKIRRSEDKAVKEAMGSRRRFAIVLAGGALVFVVAGIVLFLGGGDSLLRGLGFNPGAGDFTSGRAHFWKVGWQVFLSHPLLGAGFDAFGVAFTRFDTMNGFYRIEQAHNDYLQTLADSGIAGLLCVAAFIYFLFKKNLAAVERSGGFDRGAAIGAMAGCAGILIHSFFDFPLRTPANAFFFLTLATIATTGFPSNHRTRKRKLPKPSEP